MKFCENNPQYWQSQWPWPLAESHKHSRGHVLIRAGEAMPGAAQLAALGARRIGAGLVTLAATALSCKAHALAQPGLLTVAMHEAADFAAYAQQKTYSTLLIGVGNEPDEETRQCVLAVLATGKPCVLDAGALTAFADNPDSLFKALHAQAVLTPHEGEFARLFAAAASRQQAAWAAAVQTGAVVVLKGAETIITDGKADMVINRNAPPWLATAGTGDVLAGMIAGLMAQGMPPYQAACAAVWVHGEAATICGVGLLAEDLPETIPAVLAAF